jgi:uncharacterized protein (DUF58 family)
LVAAVAAVALVLGGWWHYAGLAGIGAALAALILVDLLAVAGPGPLRVRRVVKPLQVSRHGRCTGRLTIDHSGRRLPFVVDGAEPAGELSVPIPATWLRSGQPVEVGYDVPTASRGLRVIGPTRLRRLGPTGLAARAEPVGGTVAVRVVPRVLPVRGVPPGARRGHISGDERVARGGTDLVALREYLPGDDLRRLHWATSARTGTLMVRDDADPSQAQLTVLLDDRAASYGADPEFSEAPEFEDAVDVAAALTASASAAGHPVRLRTLTGRVDVVHTGASAGTGRAAPELLAALADVALVPAEQPTPGGASYDLDIVAIISGPAADQAELVVEAGRAVVGVVLAVDPRPDATVLASGAVVILRGGRAEDLLALWDSTVADGISRW